MLPVCPRKLLSSWRFSVGNPSFCFVCAGIYLSLSTRPWARAVCDRWAVGGVPAQLACPPGLSAER